MRENSIFSITAPHKRNIFLLAACALVLLLLPAGLCAQADSASKEGISITPSMQFSTVQKADSSIDLKAVLKTKIKGTPYKLPLLKVSFVAMSDSTTEKKLGFVITDRNGKAVLHIKADSLPADKEGKVHFNALFGGNKQMEPAEGEATIKKARLNITATKGDSSYSVKIKLADALTGAPVAKTTVGIFVKRLFYPLKLGEGTTDDSGEASIEIPAKLPGNAKGDLDLIAKVDENETYGSLEADVHQKWGTAVSDKIQAQPRALWSSHPPLWMLFTFLILMTTVWGHYIVIVYQLFKLRKEEPHITAGQ